MKNPIVPHGATVATMTSREIAELTGKQHQHVKRDIEGMLAVTEFASHCTQAPYQDSMNRPQQEFILHGAFVGLILEKYKGLARVPNRLQEDAALKTIEQLLGIQLIRQFSVLSYRIDGYHAATNTAYEIDEPEHKSRKKQDAIRQREIEAAIGCTFVRISL